jgi:hypothetical protein
MLLIYTSASYVSKEECFATRLEWRLLVRLKGGVIVSTEGYSQIDHGHLVLEVGTNELGVTERSSPEPSPDVSCHISDGQLR